MNQNGIFGKMVWDNASANGEQEIRTEIKRLTYENGSKSESEVVSNESNYCIYAQFNYLTAKCRQNSIFQKKMLT